MKELIDIQQNINIGLVWGERVMQKLNRLPQKKIFVNFRSKNRNIVEATMMNALLLLNDTIDFELKLNEKFKNNFSVLEEQK